MRAIGVVTCRSRCTTSLCTDPNRRFSPFCWRARMALAHKGQVETKPWRFTEKDKLPAP